MRVQGHIDYITPGIRLLNAAQAEGRPLRKKRQARWKKRQQFENDIANVNYDVVDELLTSVRSCSSDITPTCIRSRSRPGFSEVLPGCLLLDQINTIYLMARGRAPGISWAFSNRLASTTTRRTSTPTSTISPRKFLPTDENCRPRPNSWKRWYSWVANGSHPELRLINGAEGPTTNINAAGEEADLDFEVAMPLIWPQKTVLFQTDDEIYQLEQTKATTKYIGFFNSMFYHSCGRLAPL